MQYKHSFGFYELFWLSEKWIALSQVIEGKRESKIDEGTCGMCSGSSIKFFNLQIFNLHINPSISRVEIDAVTYRMLIKWSWIVPLTIWFDSGSIGNLKIIPILAGLMIANTSLFHANSNKTNNIQSDHQHMGKTDLNLIFDYFDVSIQNMLVPLKTWVSCLMQWPELSGNVEILSMA